MTIDTVLFDMGGTIEEVHFDRNQRLRSLPLLLGILAEEGIVLPGGDGSILDTLLARNAEYKVWSEKTGVESPPASIWLDWNLRDYDTDPEKVTRLAERLSYAWETGFFVRRMRKDAAETLEGLRKRGYKLGVISNTSSRTQVFRTLAEYGIEKYFSCVVLSSMEGIRKPEPAIFEAALRAVGSEAGPTAYVGDTISRDVIGSKRAGYALAFLIRSFLTSGSDATVVPGAAEPDYVVDNLSRIVTVLDGIRAGMEPGMEP